MRSQIALMTASTVCVVAALVLLFNHQMWQGATMFSCSLIAAVGCNLIKR